tara:strand:+ start:360 stop:641 length:282 start_codon:yes stop_codon:yes gene_type:complete
MPFEGERDAHQLSGLLSLIVEVPAPTSGTSLRQVNFAPTPAGGPSYFSSALWARSSQGDHFSVFFGLFNIGKTACGGAFMVMRRSTCTSPGKS